MVTSNSKIIDMPIFPDDLVPKMLAGTDIRLGWFPYIHGICSDERGKTLYAFISIDLSIDGSLGGPKFVFKIQGQTYAGSFDKSALNYSDGVLTLGTKPKFTIDYHHPHRVRVDVNSTISVELYITYRGPPLWYSKSTNPSDMFNLTKNSFVGGYDAPCKINGSVSSAGKSLSFSGYGDYEHVWLLGSFNWEQTNSRWLIFNDSRFYGVATKTYDIKTKATLASTGRFGMEDGSAFVLDDFEWIDDNLQPPRFVMVKGLIEDLNGIVKSSINLKTIQSVNLIIPSIYTQHKMTGKIFETTFNGFAWCETHKPSKSPQSQSGIVARAIKLLKVFK